MLLHGRVSRPPRTSSSAARPPASSPLRALAVTGSTLLRLLHDRPASAHARHPRAHPPALLRARRSGCCSVAPAAALSAYAASAPASSSFAALPAPPCLPCRLLPRALRPHAPPAAHARPAAPFVRWPAALSACPRRRSMPASHATGRALPRTPAPAHRPPAARRSDSYPSVLADLGKEDKKKNDMRACMQVVRACPGWLHYVRACLASCTMYVHAWPTA